MLFRSVDLAAPRLAVALPPALLRAVLRALLVPAAELAEVRVLLARPRGAAARLLARGDAVGERGRRAEVLRDADRDEEEGEELEQRARAAPGAGREAPRQARRFVAAVGYPMRANVSRSVEPVFLRRTGRICYRTSVVWTS